MPFGAPCSGGRTLAGGLSSSLTGGFVPAALDHPVKTNISCLLGTGAAKKARKRGAVGL